MFLSDLFKGFWKALRGLGLLGAWILFLIWTFFRARMVWLQKKLGRRLANAGCGVVFGVFMLVTWKLGPLIYGRFHLQYLAKQEARWSLGRSTLEVASRMQQRAFQLGLRQPIPDAGAFTVEQRSEDGMDLCVITFAFPQEVDVFGMVHFTWSIKGSAEAVVNPDPPKPGLWEQLFE